MVIAFVFAAAAAAFLVSAVAGGGAGLVLVPLLRLLVPIASVPAALSIGTAASAISRLVLFRQAICWPVVRRFVPAALPGAALGAWLLTRFQPAYVELLIACFLLANLPALFRPAPSVQPSHPSMRTLPLVGAVAGLLSGFTGAVGLLFNGLYARLGLSRHQIVATRATNDVLLHLLKILLYSVFGLLSVSALAAGALLAIAAIASSLAARYLLPKLREALFRRIGQVAMVAAGIAMFALSSRQIATIHDIWLAHVAPGGEHEVQLHWGGARRLTIEAEDGHALQLERSIPFEALPPAVRREAEALTPRLAITDVEIVHGSRGPYYEIYFIHEGRSTKRELAAPPR